MVVFPKNAQDLPAPLFYLSTLNHSQASPGSLRSLSPASVPFPHVLLPWHPPKIEGPSILIDLTLEPRVCMYVCIDGDRRVIGRHPTVVLLDLCDLGEPVV